MNRPAALTIVALIIAITACDNGDEAERQTTRELDFRSTVYFLTAESDTVTSISAAVADDERSRSTGLMDVFEMPSDKGMLFIFDDEQPRSFWMANTPLALDIIFVNSDMQIVRIHPNTQPYSDRNIRSEHPAKYVVETNAGYTLRHDIREGMKIAIGDQQ